jgi:hypothetical protein
MRLRTVMNWPSLRDAREHVLRFLAEISAPFEYVQKKWAEKHPTYGDVAFGDSIWSTGNCVFREDNTKDDSGYTDEIFRFIDSAIRGREGEPVEEGLPVGLTLDSRLVQSDGGWRIVLKGFAEDATVVLSAKHVSFLRKEGFVLAKPKGDIPQTLAVRVRIGTVANGWKNYAAVLERPAQAAAPTPEAKKKE